MKNIKKYCIKAVRQTLFLLLWVILGFTQTWAQSSSRQTINFNREWKYARGDYQGAEQANFDDKQWETIGLPHSFSIPYFMSNNFYVGYGWYRKTFHLSTNELSKQIFLEFDGIFQEAEIFVNGVLIQTHVGGYTGFNVNLSSAVKKGNNLIAVRVNNIWKPDVAPRAGEHVFSGGIYRNVRLVLKAPTHIDWYGTFITTPDLGKNKGKSSIIKITTVICNHSKNNRKYRLTNQIVDPNGKVIRSVESSEYLTSHENKSIEQTTSPITTPLLWCPKHPYLYKVITQLFEDEELIDEYESTFGFRWFEWTVDKGFFLNGEHLYFRGANVHQDQAGWGDAVTEAAMQRDVNMMKEAGFNFIRGSHYPHAPAFSQACDEEGILFWSEAPFWGIGGFKPDGYWDSSAYPINPKDIEGFENSTLQQLEEMIRIHRNHPSIIAWSMCNEAFFSAPEAMDGVRHLLKKMVERSHQLDPTRPAAIGGSQRPLGKERIDLIGDIAGYNGDGSTVPDFQHPDIPNIVSEYGSTTAERPGEYTPGWGDLLKDDGWKGPAWRSGQAIWCGFDHGSIAGSQLGKMGIVDYFRIPKRSWYWYRNEYNQINPPEWPEEGIPAQIRLEATKNSEVRADGTDDVKLTISILDANGKELNNSPEVAVKVISGPGEFPTGNSILFNKDSDIRITDGKAAIAFRSFYAGTSVIKASSPGLQSAQIEINFVAAPVYEKGKTPTIKERPYIRFTKEKTEKVLQTFGRNNPTFASSSENGYPAGYAADGNNTTWWKPAKADKHIYWMLDTEKGLELKNIEILFPHNKIYRYKVETSMDNQRWETLSNKTGNTEPIDKQCININRKVKARFIRISFLKKGPFDCAALTEMTVRGFILE